MRGWHRAALRAAVVLCVMAYAPASRTQALPFLPTGDTRLRHEVELNEDEDRVPLSTTWPIPTLDIPEQYRDMPRSLLQPGSAQDAGWFMDGAVKPTRLRVYEDTPRENGEAGVQAGWAAGDYAGGVFRLSYAFNPQDDMHYRADDSYASWRIGNWWVTLGAQERWWGPGWDGSLILSNNARPMPGISLDRASSLAPDWKWLRWIGPWRLTTMMDRMEDCCQSPTIGKALFWGLRFTAQPISGLEIGVSRTAEWCGKGRPCGLHTFYQLLIGHLNALANNGKIPNSEKPGVQFVAVDLRYRVLESPLAVYWQEMGQTFDSGNYRPRQTLQLIGIEYAGRDVMQGRMRTFLEFAGTTCGELSSTPHGFPDFGCAYEKDIYTEGYRYRGRVIGDAMDRDGRRFTLGIMYQDHGDRFWQFRVRRIEINRGGIVENGIAPQTVSQVPEQLWSLEPQVDGTLRGFKYSLGTGVDRTYEHYKHGVSGRGFLSLSHGW